MNLLSKIIKIIRLPKISIPIIDDDDSGEIKSLYNYFNSPHKKYKIIKNKKIGVMLYKLPKTLEEYTKRISGKNGTGYFSRRCKKMGYYTKFFVQGDFLDELYQINTSSNVRQGRQMSKQYLEKVEKEEEKKCIKYFGVFSKDDQLVGYIKLVITEQLYIISKLLGHKDYMNDGIMYLILNDLTTYLIEEGKNTDKEQYFMYDTFFGGSDGIKLYKKRNCFEPYNVKWKYISK